MTTLEKATLFLVVATARSVEVPLALLLEAVRQNNKPGGEVEKIKKTSANTNREVCDGSG